MSAPPISIFLFLAPFLILAHGYNLTSTGEPNPAIVVCNNTPYPLFCLSAINSDHHYTSVSDQYEVADIIFRLALSNSSDTGAYIAAKIESGSGGGDGGLKNCLANYNKCNEILKNMLNDLKSGMFSNLGPQSDDLEGNVVACAKGLQQGRVILAQRNKNMLKLVNMCVVVSKLFNVS